MAGKTYFDLCNEVLTELFYEKASTFEELSELTEGIKVKQDLNSALALICNSENSPWAFRECEYFLSLVPDVYEYEAPNGFIDYLKYRDVSIVLNYEEEHKYLAPAKGMPTSYWMDEGIIKLYPMPDESQLGRLIKVKFYTNDFAKNACGVYKPLMELECDEPIIPAHHRDILKWKVCADWRGSLNDAKAAFYEKRFRKAYTNLVCDQRLTLDNRAGFNIMPPANSANSAILRAFYNPRTNKLI